jgi:putative ABC transport system permease protein
VSPITLILRSLARRPLRTGVTAAGVALAVAALFSLLSFQRGYQAGMSAELDRLGAHVLVVPKGCPYDAASIALHGASWPCYLEEKYLDQVRATRHVDAAAPVFMSAVYAEGGTPTVYCGVDPALLRVKRSWRVDGAFPSAPGELLAGAGIAARRGWAVGAEVTPPGLPGGRRARVSGILAATQGADDEFVFLRLRDAQSWFGHPGKLTHLLVRLDEPERMDEVVQALRGCEAGMEMNIVPLAHLFRTIQELVRSTRLLLVSVAAVALLAAAAGVSNALVTAVAERTREIGVLRALGANRSGIFALIWGETAVLCLLGGATGIGASVLFARALEAWLRTRLPFTPSGPLLQPEALVVALCLAGSVALGTLAGLLPAWRAARLPPAEAIRRAGGT